MGKQAMIRKIRKRIKSEKGISRKLAEEVSIAGYTMIIRSNKSNVKVQRV